MTTMLTWQADDGHGLEGTRLLLGAVGFRALGRMVRTDFGAEFTASYRLIVREDGTCERVSVTSATAQRERHLTLNRTEDGFWLIDTGTGGNREAFAGAVDVDLAHSPMFNSLPIRRLGLHREAGEHTVPMVYVTLPGLELQLVQQTYRTISVLDQDSGQALIEFRSGDFSAELVVDADGVVASYPGVAVQLTPGVAPATT